MKPKYLPRDSGTAGTPLCPGSCGGKRGRFRLELPLPRPLGPPVRLGGSLAGVRGRFIGTWGYIGRSRQNTAPYPIMASSPRVNQSIPEKWD